MLLGKLCLTILYYTIWYYILVFSKKVERCNIIAFPTVSYECIIILFGYGWVYFCELFIYCFLIMFTTLIVYNEFFHEYHVFHVYFHVRFANENYRGHWECGIQVCKSLFIIEKLWFAINEADSTVFTWISRSAWQ